MHNGAFKDWLLRVIVWDGSLPLLVIVVAPICRLLFPNKPEVGQLLSMFVPVLAFLTRCYVARVYFASHPYYRWQPVLFLIGIMLMTLLDCVGILFRLDPDIAGGGDWQVWLFMFGIYFVMMLAAFFPRAQQLPQRGQAAASSDWTLR